MHNWIRWIVFSGIIGALTGTASAVFLAGLDLATETRLSISWLLWLLPFAGVAISLLYSKFGSTAGKGNNLIVEQIRHTGNVDEQLQIVPARMAPFVLLGTWITHLFGGSAGREGTAVQMGGSLAELFGRFVKVEGEDRRILLLCGVSGGFASVFGTPLAGALFALEVVVMGRLISPRRIVPCIVAAFVGDGVTQAWGIHHVSYQMADIPAFSGYVLLKVMAAAVLFGLMSLVFNLGIQYVKRGLAAFITAASLKSFLGGFIIIGLVYALGTRDYLGLSQPLLTQAFQQPLSSFAFLWKTVFTVITLGSGYTGGEVTPLFVIGAALGNALSPMLQLGVPFLAAMGLIGVFSGAVNAPVTCFCLGLELFGYQGAAYIGLVSVVSYMFSGHASIYSAQLMGVTPPRYFIKLPGWGLILQSIKRK